MPPPAPPPLAVIIPCYNAEAWIGRAIGSVLAQDYPNLHLIVIDDGSTDGSAEIVRRHERVTLKTIPNRGANHARNLGLALARDRGARFVTFFDADDHHEGEVLQGAAQVATGSDADMVLTPMRIERPDGSQSLCQPRPGQTAPEAFFEDWMRGHFFHPGAILWRMDFLDRLAGWDESLIQSQDTDFCLNAMFEAPVIRANDRGISVYRQVNAGSLSRATSPRSTADRILVRARLLRRMAGTPFAPLQPLLLGKLYRVTREAFQAGQIEEGRRGLAEMRSLGFRGNPGSPGHRLVSDLIGLEAKVRLWGN